MNDYPQRASSAVGTRLGNELGEIEKPPFFQRLRTRLLLLVILAVTPMLALVLYGGWEQRRQGRAELGATAQRITRTAIKQQEQYLEDGKQLLSTLSQMGRWQFPTNQNDSTSALFANLMLLHPLYLSIGAVDADGRVIATGTPLTPEDNVAGRPWFRQARETRGFMVGDYQVEQVNKKPALRLVCPILDRTNQVFLGLVYASLDFSWIKRLAEEASLPPNSTLTVLDRSWRLVVRFPETDSQGAGQMLGGTPVDTSVLSKAGDTFFEGPGLDGIWRLYSVGTLIGGDAEPDLRVAVGIPSSSAFAGSRRAMVMNLMVLSLVTLMTGLLAWFGAERMVLQGIQPLLGVARQLHLGNLSARTGMSHRGGELQLLAAAFDEMASSLEQRVAERQRAEVRLKSMNEELEQKVAARTRELQRSNEELEEFAYAASHDLQEPLRMIAGHLQLLERRYKGKLGEDADEFIHYAVDGAKRMDQLIVDLLAYSRVGTHGQPFADVDLNRVLARALDHLTLRIEEGKAVVQSETLPKVQGDTVQLTQLFQNLLGNAIKFRGTQPPVIDISCLPSAHDPQHFWTLAFKDNGIGIESQYFERIFQIFQRLHTREEFPGTGIGLSICKRIVDRHGGKIWLESALGQGTTFFFTLPRP